MHQKYEPIDRFWRAANYLTAAQIYLKQNPLMEGSLKQADIKTRLLGHWGTSPGLNFIYAHLNRLIQETDAEMLYITGPGHGGPALRACVYLEGVMSEVYPELPHSLDGLKTFMRDFSWPGGVPSHVSPPTPGSIHEGGELGYALVHAYGAVLDNPNLTAVCVVGDGEAETGPLATSWHSNKFINPKRDGIVLPILQLNEYKISGPTIFGRMPQEKREAFFTGCGYKVHTVSGHDPEKMHAKMWETLDQCYREIQAIKREPLTSDLHYPMIILHSPKGWTGPKVVDGKKVEGSFRSHQVPLSSAADNPEHFDILKKWLKSYRIDELIDPTGKLKPETIQIVPRPERRMGASPHANGGLLTKPLKMPNFRNYAVDVPSPGSVVAEATRQLGKLCRDIYRDNPNNFRLFCPDETKSNRFDNVFEVTSRMYLGDIQEGDEFLSDEGRVMEVLSEHMCQGWLEGYLLTGRHGIFPCYEAFALIVDSMLNQHGKWLKACREIPWRKSIPSLNYVLTSHAWRQDHNGYSHQGPGFIESMLQKKSSVARVYLPPDANCLLSVGDHCLRSYDYINLIVSGKQPMPQWLTMEQAIAHCEAGASIWEWASDFGPPDLVMAAAGDTPTLEIMAAKKMLKETFPSLKIQVVNVVDLFALVTPGVHPHGMHDTEFYTLFPKHIPTIFAFHGHPNVLHELVYKRTGDNRFHVHGYIEEGTTTTPYDMVVCNKMSRHHLAMSAVHHLPQLDGKAFIESCVATLKKHKTYIYDNGHDLPEVANWTYS